MAKFKKGDKVRCVNLWNPLIESATATYTVTSVRAGGCVDECIFLEELAVDHPGHYFYSHRYELVQPVTTFYYRDLNSAPAIEHGPFDTEELAIQAIKDMGISGNEYEVVKHERTATVKVTRSVDVEVTR